MPEAEVSDVRDSESLQVVLPLDTSKAATSPAGNGATTTLSLTAGLTLLSSVAVCGNPRAVHNSAPSAPFSAWSTLSAETKKTFPPRP